VGCQQGYVFLAGITFGAVRWIRPHADLWRFMGGDHHINQSTFGPLQAFPMVRRIGKLVRCRVDVARAGGDVA
jgi:hypothetical protein